MKKGDIHEGWVVRYDYPGQGVLISGSREILLKGVLPGQKVRCRIKKVNSSRCEAALLEVLESSPLEQEPGCRHFPACGGCQMQTLPYPVQLSLKEEQIIRLFENVVKEPPDGWFEGIKPSPDMKGYRNKMEFTFGDSRKDGPLVLGMHKKGSFHDIIDTQDCQIVDPDMRMIRSSVLELAEQTGFPYFHRRTHTGFYRHLLVRKAKASGQILIDLVTTTQFLTKESMQELDRQLVEKLTGLSLAGIVTGILHTYNDSVADTIQDDHTDVLYGTNRITESLLGMEFEITPFSFFQTNSAGAEVLYDTVRSFIGDTKDKVIFDLYSGTGTIAQILAPVARHVTGVEIVEEAVEAARKNAQKNQIQNCDFLCGDVLKMIDLIKEKPDVIVLDPPRDGIHPRALPKILKYGVDTIVYISCKATSLKRDLVVMQQAGYHVERMVLVDLFPYTCHVECIALMTKERG